MLKRLYGWLSRSLLRVHRGPDFWPLRESRLFLHGSGKEPSAPDLLILNETPYLKMPCLFHYREGVSGKPPKMVRVGKGIYRITWYLRAEAEVATDYQVSSHD